MSFGSNLFKEPPAASNPFLAPSADSIFGKREFGEGGDDNFQAKKPKSLNPNAEEFTPSWLNPPTGTREYIPPMHWCVSNKCQN